MRAPTQASAEHKDVAAAAEQLSPDGRGDEEGDVPHVAQHCQPQEPVPDDK